MFTICVVIDSTAFRWLSSSRPSSPSALRSSASRISSARARSDAIAGHDVERRLPLVELLRLRVDDRLGALGLAAPARERLGDDRLEIVDVEEIAAVELVDRRVEVARDGEVDQQQPAAAPLPPARATVSASST